MGNDVIYDVCFPNIGISLAVNPIAFSFGSIDVHWYGIILACSFMLGYRYVCKRASCFGIDKNILTDIVIFGTICGIIGARLYYVIFYPGDFYKLNPDKIFCIPEGGLAIYGGIIGGLLGGGIFAKLKKVKLLPLLDLISIGLALGQTLGRWGNFVNQEAFGSETNLPWGMSSQATLGKVVHPCFLYESLGCFVVFLLLHFISKSCIKSYHAGSVFLTYLLLYGLGRFFIEEMRTDSLMFYGMKVSQLLSGLLCLISCVLLVYFRACLKNKRGYVF